MTLIDLRNAIEKVYRKVLEDRGGEATNDQILAEVRSRHTTDIQQLSPKLIDGTLTKLINDVSGRRRGTASNADRPDLFGDYPGILPTIVLGRGKKKIIAKATVLELQTYLQTRERKSQDRNKELKDLLKDCEIHVRSPDDTIEVLLRRKNEAENSSRQRPSTE